MLGHHNVLSFLHRPHKISVFCDTLQTHRDYGDVHVTFCLNFLTLKNMFFVCKEHMHLGVELHFGHILVLHVGLTYISLRHFVELLDVCVNRNRLKLL
jgi:hypothetical protein